MSSAGSIMLLLLLLLLLLPVARPSVRYDLLDGATSSAGEAANDNPGVLLRGSKV